MRSPLLDSKKRNREGEAPAEPPQPQPSEYPVRHRPAHGVLVLPNDPTIVYLTVCAKGREKWLATPAAHRALCGVWQEAKAWRVGRYIILPDHLHVFAAWIDGTIALENWVQYWKSQFTKLQIPNTGRWQAGHWDTRIRGFTHYESKWNYVRDNPVRHKLVAHTADWPYQGEMYILNWGS